MRPHTLSCVGGLRAGSLCNSHFWVWVGLPICSKARLGEEGQVTAMLLSLSTVSFFFGEMYILFKTIVSGGVGSMCHRGLCSPPAFLPCSSPPSSQVGLGTFTKQAGKCLLPELPGCHCDLLLPPSPHPSHVPNSGLMDS